MVSKRTKPEKILTRVVILICVAICLTSSIIFYSKTVYVPQKLSLPEDSEIVISDGLGMYANKEDLKNKLKEFQDKTGITISIYTIKKSKANPSDVSEWTYATYCRNIHDEKHWLITVCWDEISHLSNIRGEEIKDILTDDMAQDFVDTLVDKSNTNGITRSEALMMTLDDLMSTIMDKRFNLSNFIFANIFIVIALVIVSAYFIVPRIIKRVRKKAEENDALSELEKINDFDDEEYYRNRDKNT